MLRGEASRGEFAGALHRTNCHWHANPITAFCMTPLCTIRGGFSNAYFAFKSLAGKHLSWIQELCDYAC
jgi:hypothetical protein